MGQWQVYQIVHKLLYTPPQLNALSGRVALSPQLLPATVFLSADPHIMLRRRPSWGARRGAR